uniref:Uncharacterized protein n=1 Tax=Clandestinovirus TaxID=2831644 RepID=A0A8F8PJT0_9VIRU|nr:hypothetical protein KOM_12_8 [Clandestinovirus]
MAAIVHYTCQVLASACPAHPQWCMFGYLTDPTTSHNGTQVFTFTDETGTLPFHVFGQIPATRLHNLLQHNGYVIIHCPTRNMNKQKPNPYLSHGKDTQYFNTSSSYREFLTSKGFSNNSIQNVTQEIYRYELETGKTPSVYDPCAPEDPVQPLTEPMTVEHTQYSSIMEEFNDMKWRIHSLESTIETQRMDMNLMRQQLASVLKQNSQMTTLLQQIKDSLCQQQDEIKSESNSVDTSEASSSHYPNSNQQRAYPSTRPPNQYNYPSNNYNNSNFRTSSYNSY